MHSRRYELTDHLGNVRAVVGDERIYSSSTSIQPQIHSLNNYYAGGSLQPGRNFNASSYRFGYNAGSEKDDEITGVTGSHFTTFYREGDTRILRWWSPDPKGALQPWQSTYSFMDGNPIRYNDPKGDLPPQFWAGVGGMGLDIVVQVGVHMTYGDDFGVALRKVDYHDVLVTGFVTAATLGGGTEATLAKTAANALARRALSVGTTGAAIQAMSDVNLTKEGLKVSTVFDTKPLTDAFEEFSFDASGSMLFGGMLDASKVGIKKTITDIKLHNTMPAADRDVYLQTQKVLNSNTAAKSTETVGDFAQTGAQKAYSEGKSTGSGTPSASQPNAAKVPVYTMPSSNYSERRDATNRAAPVNIKTF